MHLRNSVAAVGSIENRWPANLAMIPGSNVLAF